MNSRKLFPLLALIAVSCVHFGASLSQTYNIHVKISNIRSNQGILQLQLFKDQASFSKEVPYKKFYASKDKMKDNIVIYTMTGIPVGTYGIAMLDDENKNDGMDYKFMIPKEGFGFSNYFHTAWSKPKFEDFKFTVSGDTDVTIKLRYI